jgi:hypothetical protein
MNLSARRELALTGFELGTQFRDRCLELGQSCRSLLLLFRIACPRSTLTPVVDLPRQPLQLPPGLLEQAQRSLVACALLLEPVRCKAQLLAKVLELSVIVVDRRLRSALVEVVDQSEAGLVRLRQLDRFLRLVRVLVAPRARVAPLDLGPEAGAEALLLLHLDSELFSQHGRQDRTGHQASLHENLADSLARRLLLHQCLLKLLRRDQALLHEELSKQLLRNAGRFHVRANRHVRGMA